MTVRIALALVCLAAAMSRARAADYAEANTGDLSNDRLVPTPISLDATDNHISGSISNSDLDYFAITIAAGSSLAAVHLESYSSSNSRAFIGMQSGPAFSVAPVDAVAELLLGYTHFGFDNVIGHDLLAAMGANLGVIGFTAPLPAGTYTMWINQTEAAPTQYGFDFVVVPEPAVAGASGASILVATSFRRSRRPMRRFE